MPAYPVRIVDAFATQRYAGNPCGVITNAEGLSDAQMQAIARELNLSETAFVLPSKVADFRVRFFTPAVEIPLAGHPTIATMHALVEDGRISLSVGPRRVHQELRVGVLPVDIDRDGRNVRITMTQAPPEFGPELDRARFARALGISLGDLRTDAPIQVVSTGTPQAMVPVASLNVLQRLQPAPSDLVALERESGFFSTHVFCLEAFDTVNRAHARHFAPGAGISEDPVTGSASGGMAAYLWRHGLLREPRYTVEQGHIIGRPGIVGVEVDARGDAPIGVRVSGTAITVLEGTLRV